MSGGLFLFAGSTDLPGVAGATQRTGRADMDTKDNTRASAQPAAVDSSGDVTDQFYPTADDSIHGYGAQLLVGDGATPTEKFEAIAGVTKITPGGMQTADIKTTHLRSPDAHEEHRAGIRDSAAFSLDCVWLPKSQSQSNAGGGTGPFTAGGVIAMWRDRKNRNFKIVLNDGDPAALPTPIDPTEWPFRGYISQFQPTELNNTDVTHATVGIQPAKAYDADLP